MSHYNNIEISGYAGLDGTSRYTSGGKGIATVRIGVGQGEGKPTMWLSIDAWEDSAAFDVVMTVKKGDGLGVRGRLAMREWTDNEGNKRQSWQVTAQEAEFVQLPPREGREPRQERQAPAQQADRGAYSPKPAPPQTEPTPYDGPDDSDIPW